MSQDESVIYEMFVKMSCESCVSTIKSTLQNMDIITLDLANELVIVKTNVHGDDLVHALENAGMEVRIIGASSVDMSKLSEVPSSVGTLEESTAVVAEFKGEKYGHGEVMGVSRLIQTSSTAALFQTTISGLRPDTEHSIFIHRSGVAGAEGPVYDRFPPSEPPAGSLASSVMSDNHGVLHFRTIVRNILVWDIIGRRIAIHDRSHLVASSILARSAAVGANHKQLCTCDGTTIWESPQNDKF